MIPKHKSQMCCRWSHFSCFMAFLLRASPHKRALCNSSEGLVNWQTLIGKIDCEQIHKQMSTTFQLLPKFVWLFRIYWRHEIGDSKADELCYSLVDLLIMLVIWKDLSSNGEFHLAHRAVWKFHGEIAFKGGTGRALIPVYFYTHPQFSIGSTTENSINNILMKWVLLHNDWSAECCFFM